MKRLPLLSAILLFLFAAVNITPAQTVQLTVANQFVSHDTLYFDIFMQATVGTAYLGNCDLVLTFSSANFTNPVLADTDQNLTGVNFGIKNSNNTNSFVVNYETNSISPTIIGSSLIINVNGPTPGSQNAFNSSVPKLVTGTSYKFGTYCVSGITNTAGTTASRPWSPTSWRATCAATSRSGSAAGWPCSPICQEPF